MFCRVSWEETSAIASSSRKKTVRMDGTGLLCTKWSITTHDDVVLWTYPKSHLDCVDNANSCIYALVSVLMAGAGLLDGYLCFETRQAFE